MSLALPLPNRVRLFGGVSAPARTQETDAPVRGRHRPERLGEAAIAPYTLISTSATPAEPEVGVLGIDYDRLDRTTQEWVVNRVLGTLDPEDLAELGVEPGGDLTLLPPSPYWDDPDYHFKQL